MTQAPPPPEEERPAPVDVPPVVIAPEGPETELEAQLVLDEGAPPDAAPVPDDLQEPPPSATLEDAAQAEMDAALAAAVPPDLTEQDTAPFGRPRPACALALFGKLPTRGDFIARNMPRAVQRPFEDWLIPLVQETRAELGANWTQIWRGAGPWRFWIGPEVLGGSWQRDLRKPVHEQSPASAAQGLGAITGVLLPSADRHGRDFPVVLLLADAIARLLPPPVTSSPDREWYDLCDEVLYAARAGAELTAIEARLDQFPGPLLPEGAEDMDALLLQQALWAQSIDMLDNGTSRIWSDIARADHHLAASHRSYWWQAPRAGAAQRVLALAGLPDAGSFAFMLSQGHPEVLSHGADTQAAHMPDPDM
jgi:hypothetical protein